MDKLSTRFDLNEILGNEIGREKKKKTRVSMDYRVAPDRAISHSIHSPVSRDISRMQIGRCGLLHGTPWIHTYRAANFNNAVAWEEEKIDRLSV